jgi:hypothetical protein
LSELLESDRETAAMITRWRDRILKKAGSAIDALFIDAPVEDFTEEQQGFERGLRAALDEVRKLMHDDHYFR